MDFKFDYTRLANWDDMICYADEYDKCVEEISRRFLNEHLYIVEFGIRAGVSTRILRQALLDRDLLDHTMILFDPIRHQHTKEFDVMKNIVFVKSKAELRYNTFLDEQIHLLHIDVNDHEYQQTKEIFELYARKIKMGGIVIFHDCTDHFGVKKYVKEIEQRKGWTVEYCKEHPDSPKSTPAIARKGV
jgi:predicted O-methyltransferase YrrM